MKLLGQFLNSTASALMADPFLKLAAAVATFDPWWNTFEEWDTDYDDDPQLIALQVSRRAFPDIYAEAHHLLRTGASEEAVNRFFCQAFTAKGIPLQDIEGIGFGIPIDAYGADLCDREFYDTHPDLLPILELLGLPGADDDAYVDVPDDVVNAGVAIARSLTAHPNTAYKQVGTLFGWLFSCTGNSQVDYTYENLSELEPLSWTPDDIAFSIELIAEANGMMQDVHEGIHILTASPDLMAVLYTNVTTLRKQKGCTDDYCLQWPGAGTSAERKTTRNVNVLQLWDHVAEAA